MRKKVVPGFFVGLLLVLIWMTGGCNEDGPVEPELLADDPGFLLSATTLEITEGGPGAAYAIALNSAPASRVQLSIQADAGLSQVVVQPDTFLVFPDNWNDPLPVLVLAVDDPLIEGTQTFNLVHSFATADPEYSALTIPDVTLQVNDNDEAAIIFANTELSVIEGGEPGVYTICLSAQPNSPVHISLTPVPDNGSIDLIATPVVFSVEAWSAPQSISVLAPDDGLSGGPQRTVVISHSVESNDNRFHQIALPDVTVQISDVGTPYLVINGGTASEDSGPLTVTVSLTNPGADEISVRVRTLGDSAIAETDFLSLDQVVTFQPGGPTTFELTVHLIDDTTLEGAESFSVFLSEASGAVVGMGTAICHIEDDDLPALTILDATSGENSGPLSFWVELSEESTLDVGFWAITSSASAVEGSDFIGLNGQFSIPAGMTEFPVEVELVNDSDAEVDEHLVIQVNSVTNASVADGAALGCIEDDDGLIVFLNDIEVSEADGTAALTLALTRASEENVSVDLHTEDGTALSGVDFLPIDETVIIPAGATEISVSLTLIDDGLPEVDEYFFLNILAANGANVVDSNGLVTLTSDDVVSLSIDDVSIVEGEGSGVLTVSLDQAAPWEVRFQALTLDGSANAGVDYEPSDALHTLAAGETRISLAFNILDENESEADETFYLSLSNPQGALLADAQGVVTIVDDDFPSLSVNFVVVLEHGGPAVFTFMLDGPSGADVSFMVDTSTGTATEGVDFLGVHERFTITAGTTATTVSVVVINDLLAENLESFFLGFSDVEHATIGSGAAVGSIVDND